jgi:hypothetical protein
VKRKKKETKDRGRWDRREAVWTYRFKRPAIKLRKTGAKLKTRRDSKRRGGRQCGSSSWKNKGFFGAGGGRDTAKHCERGPVKRFRLR